MRKQKIKLRCVAIARKVTGHPAYHHVHHLTHCSYICVWIFEHVHMEWMLGASLVTFAVFDVLESFAGNKED